MWGSLALPQRGHTLRAGAPSFHAPARWLRVFIFDFFFLGTATWSPGRMGCVRSNAGEASGQLGRLVAGDLASCRQSSRQALSWSSAAHGDRAAGASQLARALVEVDAAHRAQARRSRAGTAATSGSVEHDELAHHRHQVELVADDLERVGVGDDGLVQLVDVGRATLAERRRRQRRQMPCHGTSIVPRTTMPSVRTRGAASTATGRRRGTARRRGRARRQREPTSMIALAARPAQQLGGVDAQRDRQGSARSPALSGPGRRSPWSGRRRRHRPPSLAMGADREPADGPRATVLPSLSSRISKLPRRWSRKSSVSWRSRRASVSAASLIWRARCSAARTTSVRCTIRSACTRAASSSSSASRRVLATNSWRSLIIHRAWRISSGSRCERLLEQLDDLVAVDARRRRQRHRRRRGDDVDRPPQQLSRHRRRSRSCVRIDSRRRSRRSRRRRRRTVVVASSVVASASIGLVLRRVARWETALGEGAATGAGTMASRRHRTSRSRG